ncbi:MAG: hypothetical protein ACE5EH_09560 [Gammaproteobacteria bacterium]
MASQLLFRVVMFNFVPKPQPTKTRIAVAVSLLANKVEHRIQKQSIGAMSIVSLKAVKEKRLRAIT